MKKIRVGIVGYGNLGKAVEELLYKDERFNLVCIFSGRDIIARKSMADKKENIHKYKGKIDILFLCGGSSSTLIEDAKNGLKNFCTIDAFDTHSKIKMHIKSCNKIAKENSKVAFCSFGWDPGLFSYMRVLFKALGEEVYTTWGKGVSQGHSEAIKRLNYVEDAIQYTMPNKNIIKKIKCGQNADSSNLHSRKCFVVCDKPYRKTVAEHIINMPNYFKGYKTTVKFVSKNKIIKYKGYFHKGEVFTKGGNFGFYLKTQSNPHLTAKIMINYCVILNKLYKEKQYGSYSILDVPIKNLIKNSNEYI